MGASICPSSGEGDDDDKKPPKYMGRYVMRLFGVTAPRLYELMQQQPPDQNYTILFNTLQALHQTGWLDKVALNIEDDAIAMTHHCDQRDHVIVVMDNYIVAREETRITGHQFVGCISKQIEECDVLVKLPKWIEGQKTRAEVMPKRGDSVQ